MNDKLHALERVQKTGRHSRPYKNFGPLLRQYSRNSQMIKIILFKMFVLNFVVIEQ